MVGAAEMRAVRGEISRFVDAFDADRLNASDAAAVVKDAAAAVKMLSAIKAEAALRSANTGGYRTAGHRSAADQLARESGTSVAQAERELTTAEKLKNLPATRQAARQGAISSHAASAIADAAGVNPEAEERLVQVAKKASDGELRNECAKAKAAAQPDQESLRKKARDERRCWKRTSDDQVGEIHYRSSVDEANKIWNLLQPFIEDQFDQARKQGRRDSHELYAADALLAMANAAAGATSTATKQASTGGTKAIVRIDWTALTRGWAIDGELCEIAGVGPVPVSWVDKLLASGDAFVTAVLTKGVDVCTVAHLGRRPNAFQQTALQWLMPVCSRLGCNCTENLEYDHRNDWATTHRTPTDGLDPLCPFDHDLKTHDGWALVEGTGKREMVPPDHPDHPKNRSKPPPGG